MNIILLFLRVTHMNDMYKRFNIQINQRFRICAGWIFIIIVDQIHGREVSSKEAPAFLLKRAKK